MLAMAAVVARKVAEEAAAVTVTDAGTVSAEVVSERVTRDPPVGAACVNVTVQMLEALGPRLVGAQASEETRTGATSDRLAEVAIPLREAVTVAV